MTVLAAARYRNNGHLIATVFNLHVAAPERPWTRDGREPVVMDVTYGCGIWWRNHRPDGLIMHDRDLLDGVDFRDLPEPRWSVDVAAYDPPYVSVGGRSTTGTPDFHDRFGLTFAPRTPMEMQTMINDGLDELHRVVRPGGLALVKCADYITSGHLFMGSFHTWHHATTHHWKVVDRLDMIGSARAQPTTNKCRHCITGLVSQWDEQEGVYVPLPCPQCNGKGHTPRRQVHARQNRSTLFVLTPT